MTIPELHRFFLAHQTVSTDTRKITENCIFFALKGPNFNGNAFAKEAIDKGAALAIIDEGEFDTDQTVLVDNVLETLQALALYHRNQCKAKVLALTGSNGKTTTKELIHIVLATTYRTIATTGNLNNHIGVPLTLLSITKETEVAIVEMGANHQKEIEFLSGLSQPDFGCITNFGKAHLEGFGGVEGVIKGKSELYDHLLANNRHVFLNADDPIQREKLSTYDKKFGFSQEGHGFYRITFLGANPFVEIQFEGTKVKTQLTGAYNFPNCAVAILIGNYFNIDPVTIKGALESYIPENNRSQILKRKGHHIVLDAYNANPTSMQVALESFSKIDGDQKNIFLGDMFELGEDTAREHQYIANLALTLEFKNVYLVGENFAKTKTDFQQFNSFDTLKNSFDFTSLPKGPMLIKGSRGMAMERILELL
ncbi:MAG: UDP-N-acetylmuramoyl-tripeptide--D-alanyl-D-alanine ligase [Bacteroidota bacterium]